MMDSSMEDLESKRRSTYKTKLSSLVETWRACQDVLKVGIQEVGRAERIMLGASLVHQARADAMQAMYMDVLFDDELNSVTNERKQESLFHERCNAGFDSLELLETEHSTITRGGMLMSLVESQGLIAKQFAQDALLVTTHIAKETTSFRLELGQQIQELTKRGQDLLQQFESAETKVSASWDAFCNAVTARAEGGIGPITSTTGSRRSSWAILQTSDSNLEDKTGPTATSTTTSNPTTKSPLLWNKKTSGNTESPENVVKQLEIEYGLAVVEQTSLWDTQSSALTELISSANALEAQRHAKLLELLNDYVPGQRRLYSSAAAMQTQVMEELQDGHHKMDRFYPDMDFLVHEQQHNGQEDFFKAKEIPLTSTLVTSYKVVERRLADKQTWTRVLAVVTKDDYLHLFDLPEPTSNASLSSHPEQLFMSLLPKNTPLFPSSAPEKQQQDGASSSTSSTSSSDETIKEFTPMESWFLPTSTISTRAAKSKNSKQDQKEIEVTSQTTGRFLSGRRKRLLLRHTDSFSNDKQTDHQEWMDMLQLKRQATDAPAVSRV